MHCVVYSSLVCGFFFSWCCSALNKVAFFIRGSDESGMCISVRDNRGAVAFLCIIYTSEDYEIAGYS